MTVHSLLIRAAATPAEQRYLDLYSSVADRLPGAGEPGIREAREAALDVFALRGFPHRRVEEWKYTDLRSLMPEVHPLGGLEQGAAPATGLRVLLGDALFELDAYRAVFWNGRFDANSSNIQNAAGLKFRSLRSALESGAIDDLDVASDGTDIISLLSSAFATDGAILEIEEKAEIEKPIHLIFAGENPTAQLFASRSRIVLAPHARATVIETHAYKGETQSYSGMNVAIDASAELVHIRLALGSGTKHLSSLFATMEASAVYKPFEFNISSVLARADGHIRFTGEAAACHYTGAMMLRGKEHGDFTLVVEHDAEACVSRELVKAVLDGRGRGVFQGKVVVQRGAQRTDGKQMANALLLSDDAEFDSKPELEIYADDVACGHGATTGQIDDDLMFYLQARGIPEPEARALLIASFVGEALDKIEHEALRSALQERVDAWLLQPSA